MISGLRINYVKSGSNLNFQLRKGYFHKIETQLTIYCLYKITI
ncbi:hypothetical protein LEP1GSC041_3933 [Leptospira noguchii str. 2006001870]|nr:hypothetical protein LEP1GSC041_3933 [Leptospira noguchii str. 2006001870]